MRNKFLFLCLFLFGTLTACKDTKWVDVPTGTPPEGAITGKPGEPEEPDDPTVKSFINCSYIRGDFFEINRISAASMGACTDLIYLAARPYANGEVAFELPLNDATMTNVSHTGTFQGRNGVVKFEGTSFMNGGDGNSSTQAFQTMYDAAPTYMNWLQAWGDVMQEDGGLPHVAPAGGGGGGPYWCGFIVLAPWRTYVNYGDSRLLERYYDNMKKWFGYVDRYTVNGLLKRWPDTTYRDWYLGDWLAPIGVDSGNQMSIDLVNNCFVSDCLDAMCKIATALGRKDEAEDFAVRKEKLNVLIHQTFYNDEENIYATGSQLDISYPMLVGAVPDALYDKVKQEMLARSAGQYKGHIAVGLVGVPILTDWVIRNKEADFMYDMLKQPDYPGYLHMLNNNATTTWEYWNGERSRVHNCYNGIANWFYQAVGGIRADEKQPGYRHVFIEPQIPQGVTWANTTKESPYGTIIVNWKLQDDCLMMHVVLPVGVEASVAIPSNANKGVVNGQEVKLDKQYLELGTGTYDIEIR